MNTAAEKWVDVKGAAEAAKVAERTVFRWCRLGRVVARRLAAGTGPWRVMLGPDGLPVDGVPGPQRSRRSSKGQKQTTQHHGRGKRQKGRTRR